MRTAGSAAFLTVKGITTGHSRDEFEYPVPFADAEYMLEHLCRRPLIDKIRYRIPFEGFTWEVDEFLGENRGLILAEVEFAEGENPALPPWAGEEVSADSRYYNSNLAQHPYCEWGAERGTTP